MARSISDVLVVGSGIAGLSAALGAAREGASVTVATKATRPEGASTWWAQGGIAVARTSPSRLKHDIEVASSRTADPEAVDVLVRNADDCVRDVLIDTIGVEFDTTGEDASFHFGREAAHSEDRILHVDASTGRHIHRPFLTYLASQEGVQIRDNTVALDLVCHEESVQGAWLEREGTTTCHRAGATILATGGIGALYHRSTNPDGATGDGIAMASRAGAETSDMEFVQFHPTVCVVDGDPFLVSEAVRGEGAVLRNARGERFMPDVHEDAELAPRDVVARAVEWEHEETGRVVLDVSPIDFADAFPDLAEMCTVHGVDPSEGIPVVPAEHFLCGGISVDTRGRASLDRLYAVGECARTGVHGANRLASTSLLEGLVWGLRAGEDAAGSRPSRGGSGGGDAQGGPPLEEEIDVKMDRLQRTMSEYVGLRRSYRGLRRAKAIIRELRRPIGEVVALAAPRAVYEFQAATRVALLIVEAALHNDQSVGCHYVTDRSAEAGRASSGVVEDGVSASSQRRPR